MYRKVSSNVLGLVRHLPDWTEHVRPDLKGACTAPWDFQGSLGLPELGVGGWSQLAPISPKGSR